MTQKTHTLLPLAESAAELQPQERPAPRKKTGRKAGALWARPNLVGQKFGRLTVESAAPDWRGKAGGVIARWNCVCECGGKKMVMHGHLTLGKIKSCGCLAAESASVRFTTHGAAAGYANTRTYRIWKGMITRCTNPNQRCSKRYLGRGIAVCERWMSFENFLSDMGDAPVGLSLDRKENDLGYSKDNCRWATPLEQANNKSSCHYIEHDGLRLTIAQWARRLGVKPGAIYGRIANGFDDIRAITQSFQAKSFT